MYIDIKKKHENVKLPNYATEGSAGFDLYADSFLKLYSGNTEVLLKDVMRFSISKGYIVLRPFERILIGTGLYMSIPTGYELQIRDKSGIALKQGLKVMNSPGTIDSDYRDEIGVIIGNLSNALMRINLNEKIAQGILAKHETADWIEVENLTATDTERVGGFGSTGLK